MVSKKVKSLFCIPCLIVLIYTSYVTYRYSSIPEIIPIHGYGNNVDGYGNKIYLYLTIGLNILLLLLIWVLIKIPHKLNLPIEINNDNKESIFQNIQISLVVIATIITVIFCILFKNVVF